MLLLSDPNFVLNAPLEVSQAYREATALMFVYLALLESLPIILALHHARYARWEHSVILRDPRNAPNVTSAHLAITLGPLYVIRYRALLLATWV